MIDTGMRVRHKLFGVGTVVDPPKEHTLVDYKELQIAYVRFDALPKGYSNPYMLDWDALTII